MKILSGLQKKKIFELSHSLAVIIVLGTAAIQLGRFLYIAFARISFPFTLEWMEGGSYVQVSRLLAGESLYVRPSFDFIPQIYPPVYFYLSALTSKLFGGTFLPLRLVSILATLGILVLIYALVYEQSGSKLGGLLASGLFCATYGLTGYWFDIARVDSLALAFLLLAAYFLLKNRTATAMLGGLSLALACFTKQTMLIVAGVFIIYCLFPPGKHRLIFAGTATIAYLSGTLLLDRLSGGWYSYYIFQLPGRHNIVPNFVNLIESTKDILFLEIIKPTWFAAAIGAFYLFLFPEKSGPSTANNPSGKYVPHPLWSRRAVWSLIWFTGLLAVAALWYLANLPSDTERGLLGPYSLARLLLMAVPALAGVLVAVLAVKTRNKPAWVEQAAGRLFGKIHSVPRMVLGCVLLAGILIIVVSFIKPELFNGISPAYLQRLFPYLAGPVALLALLGFSWRLLWTSRRFETWFYLLLTIGLIAVSWLGRLNPGGYANVFMPAFAGIAIAFGLGLGFLSHSLSNPTSMFRQSANILVLLLSGAQLFALLSPPSAQIPTPADKAAGLELVNRIRACPGEVYIPFHTYLAELAGKDGYAGVVEMGELRGSFGGKVDPLWEEVLGQIQHSIEMNTFEAIVQDNQTFRDVISPNYLEAGPVFEDELVFWQITGRKIRPESVYVPVERQGCRLTIR